MKSSGALYKIDTMFVSLDQTAKSRNRKRVWEYASIKVLKTRISHMSAIKPLSILRSSKAEFQVKKVQKRTNKIFTTVC